MALPGHHETTEMRDPQISRGRFEGNESMDCISDAHVVSFLKSSIAFWTLRIVIGSPYLSESCFTWSTLPQTKQTKPPAAWLVARGTPLHLRSKLRNPATTLKSQEITNIAEDSSTKLRLESSYSAEDLRLRCFKLKVEWQAFKSDPLQSANCSLFALPVQQDSPGKGIWKQTETSYIFLFLLYLLWTLCTFCLLHLLKLASLKKSSSMSSPIRPHIFTSLAPFQA